MPSVNDNFASAIEVVITTAGGTYTSSAVNTSGNTTESGEPGGTSSNVSAWWKYTPTSSGTATFDTQLSTTTGSGTDTYVRIWTGTNFGDLVNVATDDDSGGSATSLVSGLSVTSGTTYWIQVGGFGLVTMNVVVRVTGPETTGGGAIDLTPADSAHGHTSESPAITQTHAVTPADATHTHATDQPALTQTHTLAPADSRHTHTAESPAVTQSGDLAPADTAHTHTSDTPTLTQVHVVTPADSSHSHASGSPTITQGLTIQPDDSSHGHASDTPTLTQVHELAPADTLHAHAARKVTVAAQSGVGVDTSGTSNHVCLDDGTTLLHVTTHTGQVLTSGNSVNVGAFDVEFADVTP
jgi:hypothetical protein